MINCESFTDINTYTCEEYKNMFKNYNILFIGSLVNIENQEITKELLHLIELKKISIVFLAFCPLVLQLNYLNNINERVESNYLYSNCHVQLNNSLLKKLVFHCKRNTLEEFYFKYFKLDYNNENVALEIKYCNYYDSKEFILNNWMHLIKVNDGEKYSLLLNKNYKVLLSHLDEKNNLYFSPLVVDLFYYFVKYLLFDCDNREREENEFKEKLLFLNKTCKFKDISVKLSNDCCNL